MENPNDDDISANAFERPTILEATFVVLRPAKSRKFN
jgi:hypothetical protein